MHCIHSTATILRAHRACCCTDVDAAAGASAFMLRRGGGGRDRECWRLCVRVCASKAIYIMCGTHSATHSSERAS